MQTENSAKQTADTQTSHSHTFPDIQTSHSHTFPDTPTSHSHTFPDIQTSHSHTWHTNLTFSHLSWHTNLTFSHLSWHTNTPTHRHLLTFKQPYLHTCHVLVWHYLCSVLREIICKKLIIICSRVSWQLV